MRKADDLTIHVEAQFRVQLKRTNTAGGVKLRAASGGNLRSDFKTVPPRSHMPNKCHNTHEPSAC